MNFRWAAGWVLAATILHAPAMAATGEPAAAVVQATRGDLAKTITLSAELRPFQEVDIHARVAGYLSAIHYDIGDRVKKGEVIATLEIVELQDDLNRTRAAYELAQLGFHRLSDVTKARPGLVAQADVDKARAEYDIAKANYDHAKTLFDYSTITAPFDGVVTQRFADLGAMIQAGGGTQSAPVVHLADTSILRLRFPVPESSVLAVQDGTDCGVTIGATGQTIKATVTRKSDRIDSATRTMMTECDIPNPDNKLVPGMYASATLTLEREKNVVTLPIQAVSEDDVPTVWVVGADGRIAERHVQVGLKTANRVEILAGVKDGENAIFGSRNAYAIGMKVEPKTTQSLSAGAGAGG